MALESGTYINDFVTTNPVNATDSVTQGGNHLRLIKTFNKNTFPNATKPFYFPELESIDHTDTPYSVSTSQRNVVIVVDASTASVTINLADAATVGEGSRVTVVRTDTGSNTVTIDGSGAQTIDGASTRTVAKALTGKYTSVTLECDGSDWFATGGTTDLATLVTLFGFSSAGDMLYYDGSAFAKVAIGSANTMMYSTGTAPAWRTLSAMFDAVFGSSVDRLPWRSSGGWGAGSAATVLGALSSIGSVGTAGVFPVNSRIVGRTSGGTWGYYTVTS